VFKSFLIKSSLKFTKQFADYFPKKGWAERRFVIKRSFDSFCPQSNYIILIGDAKLKPSAGDPGSGGRVPSDNDLANANPKNVGGSAGGGDGSGSPPPGGGLSKTDVGSSDNGRVERKFRE
jgi:hypothetical protein